jgi:hypothetical protein
MIKAIERRLSGGYAPSPGVVCPTLTLLEGGWPQKAKRGRMKGDVKTKDYAKLSKNTRFVCISLIFFDLRAYLRANKYPFSGH